VGKIKILIADNSYLALKGFEALLSENSDFQLVAEANTYEVLFEKLKLHRPDLLIIDYTSSPFSVENIQQALKKYPSTKVLAITPNISKSMVLRAMDSGVISYLLKDCDKEEITEAIYKTVKGEKFLCGKVLDVITNEPKEAIMDAYYPSCEGVNVTDREMEIIKLVAEGHSNKQIADMLFLSTHTVTTHRKNIMGKLKVNNTAGLVLFAVKNNLLGPNRFLFSPQA
jgi:DNA-binding NarL/FixJ family response regulator